MNNLDYSNSSSLNNSLNNEQNDESQNQVKCGGKDQKLMWDVCSNDIQQDQQQIEELKEDRQVLNDVQNNENINEFIQKQQKNGCSCEIACTLI